ncbi:transporter substrate-binding domain-containing protein [Thalassomonas viridans]|uniref:Transporter substrate-binding domain-containing protein n=1 Tax=Thalassomonas viridans TaxID=137584 RepID=A0AAE9Z445_9GAMM|nr:transporter substrate-binding domain-containing protein [Thalassomonas viridans]WDE05679.1 transporter substrate-binding domain-containing protein [Thalassomonas viridans]
MRQAVKARLLTLLGMLFFSAGVSAHELITVYTENYPPYNMYAPDNKTIVGKSTELVRQIFHRANIEHDMILTTWARSLQTARDQKNTAVFSTARTADREKDFYWIGPLVINQWIFMAREEDNIIIDSLSDLKGLVIGSYRSDASAQFLAENGIAVEITSFDGQNAHKLKSKRIDLWATGILLGPYLARENQVSGLSIVKNSQGEPFVYIDVGMHLALNKNTSIDIYHRLNNAFREISALH